MYVYKLLTYVHILYGVILTIVSFNNNLITGVPGVVPSVAADFITVTIKRIVTLTLSWGEPFNNLDPIVNYTVSCS